MRAILTKGEITWPSREAKYRTPRVYKKARASLGAETVGVGLTHVMSGEDARQKKDQKHEEQPETKQPPPPPPTVEKRTHHESRTKPNRRRSRLDAHTTHHTNNTASKLTNSTFLGAVQYSLDLEALPPKKKHQVLKQKESTTRRERNAF